METGLLILLPLLAGLVIYVLDDSKAKIFALGAAILEFVISLITFLRFSPEGGIQFDINVRWIKSMGIYFNVGMDGISLLLVMLTTFLVPLIILSTFRHTYTKTKLFYSLILIMQSALVGVFVARDAFLFYVFWELALIPIYFICLLWGGQERMRITFKFFIYTLAGSLFMLLAIIYLYLQTKNFSTTGSFSIDAFYEAGQQLSRNEQAWIFWAFFLAFAIKMPVFPFHTWQPDTYTISPSAGTMLLSGIMLKMGIYGVIRWMLPVVPDAIITWGEIAIYLSVAGIVYASIIAILQKDIKRLIAYVSIAHVGLIAAGVFTNSVEGLQGSVIQMLSHGINVVGLFFIIDIISDRTKTNEISSLGGIRNEAPLFAMFCIIILLSSVALPLTSGFVGELMLLVSVFKFNIYVAAIAGLTIIFGAVYMLNSYQKIMLGEPNIITSNFKDLFLTEKIVFIPIIILIFWIGLYPKTFLDISEPSVQALIKSTTEISNLK
ncbi:MAG: NADH-quinone oxidoreductase subunit M [Cytophagaceae bacterium]|nr:NADH-quinone oxidoreductase subunit M [Cytophagaceae bacterium]